MHGVWGWDRNKDEAVVLRENYFVRHPDTEEKVLGGASYLNDVCADYAVRRSIGIKTSTFHL